MPDTHIRATNAARHHDAPGTAPNDRGALDSFDDRETDFKAGVAGLCDYIV